MKVYDVQKLKSGEWVTLWCCRMYPEHYSAFLGYIQDRYTYIRTNWAEIRVCLNDQVLPSEVDSEFDGKEREFLSTDASDVDEDDYEFTPPTVSEWDPEEKGYKNIGGPKDINKADWWKQGPKDDDD